MNFYDKITGHDMTQQQQALDARMTALPADYQKAWQAVNSQIWSYTDFSGRNLYPILDGIVGLFEESAIEGLPAAAVTGDDIGRFMADIAEAQGAKDYRGKLRDQLNRAVAKHFGK